MTNLEFREAIKSLGLSQRKAALIFDVNERTTRRWALGENKIPRGVVLALMTWVNLKINPLDLFEFA
jgi:DNA-binding transcriptional regulator YiaG